MYDIYIYKLFINKTRTSELHKLEYKQYATDGVVQISSRSA